MQNPPPKCHEIKARFDDETLLRIYAACRSRRLRRAVLIREIVEQWLDANDAKATPRNDAA